MNYNYLFLIILQKFYSTFLCSIFLFFSAGGLLCSCVIGGVTFKQLVTIQMDEGKGERKKRKRIREE